VKKHDEAYRLCLFVDVSGYSRRSTIDQLRIQGWLVDIVDRAMAQAGIRPKRSVRQQQGDGCLLLIDPHVNLTAAVTGMVSGLVEAVDWLNEPLVPAARIQLRVALDAGVVRRGPNGYVGRAVTGAARLVNAGQLRDRLAETPTPPIGLIIADPLYRDVIGDSVWIDRNHRYEQAVIQEKEYLGWAWMLVPNRTEIESGTPAALNV
jgi:class 3 adenylate cyclase